MRGNSFGSGATQLRRLRIHCCGKIPMAELFLLISRITKADEIIILRKNSAQLFSFLLTRNGFNDILSQPRTNSFLEDRSVTKQFQ
jgi:hypothetical protein